MISTSPIAGGPIQATESQNLSRLKSRLREVFSGLSTASKVERLFEFGRNHRSSNLPTSNAALDASSIRNVIQSESIAPRLDGLMLKYESITPRPDGCDIFYVFEQPGAGYGTSKLTLDIQLFENISGAQNRMKTYLDGFESDIKTAVRKSKVPLGDCSLQTETNIFWINGSAFLNIRGDILPDPFNPGPASDDATIRQDQNQLTLQGAAREIDKYLSAHAVSFEDQKKPHPKLCSAPIVYAMKGELFSLKLDEVEEETHKVKKADIKHKGIICQTENGSRDGLYSFLGLEAGTTEVRLMVLHKDTFAVKYNVVKVIIEE